MGAFWGVRSAYEVDCMDISRNVCIFVYICILWNIPISLLAVCFACGFVMMRDLFDFAE